MITNEAVVCQQSLNVSESHVKHKCGKNITELSSACTTVAEYYQKQYAECT